MPAKKMFSHASLIAGLNLIVFFYIFRSFFFADDFYYLWLMKLPSFGMVLAKVADISLHDFFRPIPQLIFGISRSIFQLNPLPYHVLNYIMTTINALLVFFLAKATTKNSKIAFISSALYIVFPGHWEAVGWPATLNTLLMTAFFLLAVTNYVRYEEEGKSANLFGSLISFIAGLLTYEASITLLLILPLYSIIKNGRISPHKDLIKLWPWAMVGLCYLALYFAKAHFFKANFDSKYQIGPHFLLNELNYLSTLIIPFLTSYKLSAVLPQALLNSINMTKGLLMALMPILILFLFIKADRISRFFVIWPVLTILPFSFFTLPPVSRYMCLPSVGFVILLASLMVYLYQRSRSQTGKNAVFIISCLIIAVYLTTMMGYQKLFTYKKEIRRTILHDLGRVLPKINRGSDLYFTDIPIRQDEITYMIYLWFNESYQVEVIDKVLLVDTKTKEGSYFFTYEKGHLKQL